MNPVMINEVDIRKEIERCLKSIHNKGAIEGADLEVITYAKYLYPNILNKYEHQLMYLLGLFFKTSSPRDVISLSYEAYANYIDDYIGIGLSPIQASIKKSILENHVFSFSAPTSAGKSHLFRDLILSEEGDIVFVVPSRALLHEYYLRISEIVHDVDSIQVLQFIDNVNTSKTKKRIFVVTPERGSDLFKFPEKTFNIKLFLYDEAQLSEDEKRGIVFDGFVRRVSRRFPEAKIVFAHPFVSNPSAQLEKHAFDGDAKAYKHQTVGKIFIEKKEDKSFYFSPNIENGHYVKNKKEKLNDPIKEIIEGGHSILIYISKSKIYKKAFLDEFSEYISLLDDITDKEALDIIQNVEDLLAAGGKPSLLISLMRKGVLIHHGSIPLQVRYLLEKFANAGYSRICFSTSTLLQGVNMPFFAVWLNGIRFSGSLEEKELAMKNLIGRAGRTSKEKNNFDYGMVIVSSASGFIKKFNTTTALKKKSQLDIFEKNGDVKEISEEFKLSIKNDQLDDEFDLPKNRIERLKSKEVSSTIEFLINSVFIGGKIISQYDYRKLPEKNRKQLKDAFKYIFEASMLRKMNKTEQSILSTSISILLWQIQGRTFKEILKMRYEYVTKSEERKRVRDLKDAGTLDDLEYQKQLDKFFCRTSPEPREIPDSTLEDRHIYSFMYMKYVNFDYDLLVYDTYDYLDKVINYSLSKVYYAAFSKYYANTMDERAMRLAQYFKYGSSDEIDVWLIRYGFAFEDIEWIREHVDYVSSEKIFFLDSVKKLGKERKEILKKFL